MIFIYIIFSFLIFSVGAAFGGFFYTSILDKRAKEILVSDDYETFRYLFDIVWGANDDL